jgi:hypothetical protein
MKKKWIVIPNLSQSHQGGQALSAYVFNTHDEAETFATNQVNANKAPQGVFELIEMVKTKENPAVVEPVKD